MSFLTRAQIPTIRINDSAFYTVGYANPGDDGAGAFYIAGKYDYFDPIQDAAGNWYSLAKFQMFRPEYWGGFGSNDSTQAFLYAIQAAVTATGGAGGVVDAGNPNGYKITKLFLQNGVKLRGRGSTPLRCNTDQGPSIVCYGSKSSVEGFDLTRISASSVGEPVSAIQFGYNEQGQDQAAKNLTINGFDIGVDVTCGVIWQVEDCNIMNTTYNAIRIQNIINPDAGDGSIENCTLSNGPDGDAAIKYLSGGGLKVYDNKILGFARALDCIIDDGASTVDLLVGGNSFENQGINCVRLGHSGTGSFSTITIEGNEFANAPVLTSIESGISNVAYSDNVHNICQYAAVAIADGADNINIDDSNSYTACPATIVDNRTGYYSGKIEYSLVKNVAIASTTDYQTIARLVMSPYRGAYLDVFIEGTLQMAGSVTYHARYLLNRESGGIGVTTIEHSIAGFPIDFALDGSSVGSLILKIKRNSSTGGTEFDGTVTIKVDGKLAGFYP